MRKKNLIVNEARAEILIVKPVGTFGDWNLCRPESILLLQRLDKKDTIKFLSRGDNEKLKELTGIFEKIDLNFWQCLITEDGVSTTALITPYSLKILLDRKESQLKDS